MKREESIRLLNQAVAGEMTAVHQYLYFHFHCDDQGYDLLASFFRRTAIVEMGHVEKLAERILFLKGDVDLKASHKVEKVNDIKGMLEMATKMEDETVKNYNAWAIEAANNADAITKTLFENLIAEEEEHYDQFDVELDHLKDFGDKYLALQTLQRSKAKAMGESSGD